ncbi:MAG TPA: SGNH hydrolase domain-containing protein [Acidimicrobiia bacterium]
MHAGAAATGVDPRTLDWAGALEDWQPGPSCAKGPVRSCTSVSGGRPRILLLGDSNAVMLFPAFKALAQRLGATLAVGARNSCPWQEDLLFAELRHEATCGADHAVFYDHLVPTFDPDVVVLVDRTFEDPNNRTALDTPAGRIEPGDDRFAPAVRRATERSIDRLRRPGRKLVLIEPTPYGPKGPGPNACLSKATSVDECRFVASPGPMPVELAYRDIADRDDAVWSFDMDRIVCPYLPICDPVVDGTIVRLDQGHVTATYARRVMTGDIVRFLRDNGIVSRTPS